MDPSLLVPPSCSSLSSSKVLFSPFLPQSPLLFKHLKNPSLSHRFRISFPRNFCSKPTISTTTTTAPQKRVDPSIFLPKKEISGPKSLFGSLHPPVRLGSSIIITMAAIVAGFGIGSRIGGTQVAGIGGAAVLGAAGGAAVFAMNACIPDVAAGSLRNLVAGCDDPAELRKEEVDGIVEKYGVSKQDEAFRAELCDLYTRFVASVIPTGAESLRGDEVEMIIKFKFALGIDDPDAASAHMEIGRRNFRQRLETGDREGDVEQRRAFQKLIYVSELVFGEASKFLLPWKRIFKVTDAQGPKFLYE